MAGECVRTLIIPTEGLEQFYGFGDAEGITVRTLIIPAEG